MSLHYPPLLIHRLKLSTIAVVFTLSTAAYGGQLPWEQSPMFVPAGQNPQVMQPQLQYPAQPQYQQQPQLLQQPQLQVPTQYIQQPQIFQPQGAQLPQLQNPQYLQNNPFVQNQQPQFIQPQPMMRLDDYTAMTGVSNYMTGSSPVVPGYISTAQNIGQWNSMPTYNGFGSIPSAMEADQMNKLLNNSMALGQMPMMASPEMFKPENYFNNIPTDSDDSDEDSSGEAL